MNQSDTSLNKNFEIHVEFDGTNWNPVNPLPFPRPQHHVGYYVHLENVRDFGELSKASKGDRMMLIVSLEYEEVNTFSDTWQERAGKHYTTYHFKILTVTRE